MQEVRLQVTDISFFYYYTTFKDKSIAITALKISLTDIITQNLIGQ
ncbi:MAG: hypothetical protein N4R24_04740 [Lactobacillus iners]|nr:hypothetical protein [Lactobacillus iners]